MSAPPAQLSENESIIQGIESFSGDCFELKSELYQTLQELTKFGSRSNPGSTSARLAEGFEDCIKKYENLLSSVQHFAAYAAGHSLDSFVNIVVEAAKDQNVSNEDLLGYLERLIHSEPSPDAEKSQVHLDHLLSFLESFSDVFESVVGKCEPSDVDIRAANNKAIECRKEVARLQDTVDKLFANTYDDWTFYITYALNSLPLMIDSSAVIGLKESPKARAALSDLILAQERQKDAEKALKSLIAKKAAERAEDSDGLKATVGFAITQTRAIGDKLGKMPTMCDGIIRKAAAFKTFIESPDSSDLILKRREVDDLELYSQVWVPVQSAFVVFAARSK
ncbi:hypothetical protein BDN72DRAFT_963946 [Pluteus cervinus]|uniref:Uncharacterized protein n=1 Tax=Pluteus cervinus TaxID=181527 RepID=A0ACD3ADC9_9AGAR|nr:hypothetical protein BDN72DRAFT_963946 [Pluteus cervinus]